MLQIPRQAGIGESADLLPLDKKNLDKNMICDDLNQSAVDAKPQIRAAAYSQTTFAYSARVRKPAQRLCRLIDRAVIQPFQDTPLGLLVPPMRKP